MSLLLFTYFMIAVCIFTIGAIYIRKSNYSDDENLMYVTLFSIFWPILLVFLILVAIAALVLIFWDWLTEHFNKKNG